MRKYSLSELYRAGLISYKPKVYIDIAEKKESLIKAGLTSKQAEKELSQSLKISERTIRRATASKKRLDNVSE